MKEKKHYLNYLLAVFATMCLTACPEQAEPEISLSPSEVEFDYTGGTKSIKVYSTCGDSPASWKITSEIPAFLTIDPMSGTGNTNVTLIADMNKSEVSDDVVITFDNGKEEYLHVFQAENPTVACSAEPVDVLSFSNGIVCGVKLGTSCKYYYTALYKKDEVNKMTDEDIASDIERKSNKMSYPDYPDNSPDGKYGTDYRDVLAWYNNITPNTEYMIVTVPYTSGGLRGKIYKYPINTKNDKYQPEVHMSQITQKTTQNGDFWKWSTEMTGYNNKCYLVYACVSEDAFDSFKREDNGIVLAWKIHQNRRNIQKDNVFNTDFNSASHSAKCREFIFPKLTSNAEFVDLPRNTTDKYIEVVIVAYDSDNLESAELSGKITDVKFEVGEESGQPSINKGDFPDDTKLD